MEAAPVLVTQAGDYAIPVLQLGFAQGPPDPHIPAALFCHPAATTPSSHLQAPRNLSKDMLA